MPKYSKKTKAKIRHSVSEIEQSDLLGNSLHQLNLLKYLVEEELHGRGDEVNAYMIAVEVLGRDKDFDPVKNTSVRVEMLRLRRSLAIYNSDIPPNCVPIIIPKRSYIPLFRSKKFKAKDNGDDPGVVPTHSDSDDAPVTHKKTLWRNLTNSYIVLGTTMAVFLVALAWIFEVSFVRDVVGRFNYMDACYTERPMLIFEDDIDNDDNFKHSIIVSKIKHAFLGYPMVIISTSAPDCAKVPIYKIKVDTSSNAQNDKVHMAILRYNDDEIIWERDYIVQDYINDNDGTQSLDYIAIVTSATLAAPNGVLLEEALGDEWRSSDFKTKYQCVVAAYQLALENNSSLHDDPLGCISEYALSEENYASVPALYALLMLRNKMHLSALNGQNNEGFDEKSYRMALDTARTIDPLNSVSLLAALHDARTDLDHNIYMVTRLNDIIGKYYDHNALMTEELAITVAAYQGEWKTAEKITSIMLGAEEIADNFWEYRALKAMEEGRFNDASQLLLNSDIDKNNVLLLVKLAAEAEVGERSAIARTREKLLQNGVDRNTGLRIINDIQFTASLKKQITASLQKGFAMAVDTASAQNDRAASANIAD